MDNAGENVAPESGPKGFWRRNAHLLLPCLAAVALAGAYGLKSSSFEPRRNVRLVLGWVYILGCLMAGGSGIWMLAAHFRGKPSTTRGFFACQVAGAIGVSIYLLMANAGFSALPR
jgi:hypothetical protein